MVLDAAKLIYLVNFIKNYLLFLQNIVCDWI
jgi:hypothetical protein